MRLDETSPAASVPRSVARLFLWQCETAASGSTDCAVLQQGINQGLVMWAHYKKTFVAMQSVIFLVTATVFFFFGRQWQMAATFFLVMQFSAVTGAVWAARVSAMLKRESRGLVRPPRA